MLHEYKWKCNRLWRCVIVAAFLLLWVLEFARLLRAGLRKVEARTRKHIYFL